MNKVRLFARFAIDSVRIVLRGNLLYWAWILTLLCVIGVGVAAYVHQS